MSILLVEMKKDLLYYDSRINKGCENMNSVMVRNVKIGEGKPKICVPIVAENKEQIIELARTVKNMSIDLVEWRADWFDSVFEFEKVKEVLIELREVLEEIPLMFTFRTEKEGGNKDISDDEYIELNKFVCDTGYVDMIDVEMFSGEDIIQEIIAYAHEKNVKVLGSNHDFGGTPSKKQLVTRFQLMQHFQADIIKIAVMPKEKSDVIALLLATEEMVSKHAKVPVVSVSMSKLGVISRITGELFGSAITFATVGAASAPGQISADSVNMILDAVTNFEL